jgi:hypothetical protein
MMNLQFERGLDQRTDQCLECDVVAANSQFQQH